MGIKKIILLYSACSYVHLQDTKGGQSLKGILCDFMDLIMLQGTAKWKSRNRSLLANWAEFKSRGSFMPAHI